LSGGEKALTFHSYLRCSAESRAVLLDEVDAPLDDPNTDRFCKMVQAWHATPVPVHFAQQDHDGDGESPSASRCPSRDLTRSRVRHRRSARARVGARRRMKGVLGRAAAHESIRAALICGTVALPASPLSNMRAL
jgi:hypothetical protein